MSKAERKYPRSGIRLMTFYEVVKTGKVRRAITRDISGGGARFIAEEVLEPKTGLKLEIKLPDRTASISCTAEVVWSKPTKPIFKSYETPESETGVKIVQIDSKEQAILLQYAALNALPLEDDK